MRFHSLSRHAPPRALAAAMLTALCAAMLFVPAAIAEKGGGGGHGGRASHGGNMGRGGDIGHGSSRNAGFRDAGSRDAGSRDHVGSRGDVRYRDAGSRDHAGSRGHVRYRYTGSRGHVRYRDAGYRDPARHAYREWHYAPRVVYHPRSYYRYGPRLSVRFVFSNFPAAGYDYYDPYCDWRFGSLGVYLDHLYVQDHPWIVRVIDVGTGLPVYTYRWVDGGWVCR